MTLQIEKKVSFPIVHNAESLADFEEWVDLVKEQTETTIYRGQRKDFPLLPNICRVGTADALLENERALLTNFKNEASRCLQVVPNNDWEWMVVAQHHGLQTRLLDWTFDPYIALWFALERASEMNSHPEVWVMNPLKEDVIENPGNTRPFQGTRTKIFKSNFNIPRLKEQKGCFVLFKHLNKNDFDFVAIEESKTLGDRVSRVRFEARVANNLMKQLNAMGYTKSHLFPNIDEVAKSVQDQVLNNNS
ncbi:MAG: FRG domain-containing protein [Rhodoferax sp.]|uniref:FRG domain-containing protein n=1 Tax=Rhodoferax sp. TaxID=50421 RepID=UPI003017D726